MKSKHDCEQIPEEYMIEIEHFRKTKIPRCFHCKKNFVNIIDSITKKKSKYLWQPDCKCVKKPLQLCIG